MEKVYLLMATYLNDGSDHLQSCTLSEIVVESWKELIKKYESSPEPHKLWRYEVVGLKPQTAESKAVKL